MNYDIIGPFVVFVTIFCMLYFIKLGNSCGEKPLSENIILAKRLCEFRKFDKFHKDFISTFEIEADGDEMGYISGELFFLLERHGLEIVPKGNPNGKE